MERYRNYKTKEEAIKDYENFKKDWKYSPEEESGEHITGLKMSKEFDKIAYEDLAGWYRKMKEEGLSLEEIREYQRRLNNQFVLMYQNSEKVSLLPQTPEERRKFDEETDKMRIEYLQKKGYSEEQIKQFEERLAKFREERDYNK